MQSIEKLENYTVTFDFKLISCLEKIDRNLHKFLIILDTNRKFCALITEGDIRRKLIDGIVPDARIYDSKLHQKDNVTLTEHNEDQASKLLNERIKYIPVVKADGIITKVIFPGQTNMVELGKKVIRASGPAFIIAEIGNNHNGNYQTALDLVDAAIEAGADAVKFQMRQLDQIYRNHHQQSEIEDLGAQYTYDLLKRFQLTNEELLDVIKYTKEKGVEAICTPFDEVSGKLLGPSEISAFKIASADMNNWPLIQTCSDFQKPLIISTGMSSEYEIEELVKFTGQLNVEVILLHCNSTYPTPYKDINLAYLERLKVLSKNNIIGYSGHERGTWIPVAAVARGAKIIEKHFTFDKNLEGNDHRVSLLPSEFKNMVIQIRDVEQAIGTTASRRLTQGELINRETLAKSLFAARDLQPGSILRRDDILIRSPGGGMPPNKLGELLNQRLLQPIQADDFFSQEHFLDKQKFRWKYFNFSRPFGIPVRFHDYQTLKTKSNFDFFEFHLSYSDLALDAKKYLEDEQQGDVFIHAPELFENDHILDLCNKNPKYRQISMTNLERTIEKSLEIARFFPKTKSPKIITNVGGWSEDTFLSEQERIEKYQLVSEQLSVLKSSQYEIIIQTMPPFPWHFGGQRYHNLFTDPNEIDQFCKDNEARICLDISHTYLTCNFMGLDFYSELRKISQHTAYMHVVDGAGIDGEGLNIGDGDIDFRRLNELIPMVGFIPEIWQGHKQNGKGFCLALEKLEKYWS